jgi:lysophospholipase L1-like esterase
MPPADPVPSTVPACRLGVLAFGDSITNGGGELQWGVALQSWAQWTARALGVPYSGYAVDGARVCDVLAEQIPAFESHAGARDARYDVGCLYIGVNDVRRLDWDGAAFVADFEPALRFLTRRCDRVLALTAPLGLGLPPAGPKVADLNAIVRTTAEQAGALVVDLSSFGARNHVMADRVHPTAFGQVAIAERALAVLAGDGLPAHTAPASMIRYRTTRRRRLQGDMTYVYRATKLHVRAQVIALGVRRARRRSEANST